MSRLLSLALLVATLVFTASSSNAAPVSRDNPFRSFNITGVNYGAQQWERAHHGHASHQHHSYGLFHR